MSRYKVELEKNNFNGFLGIDFELLDANVYGIRVEKQFKNRDSLFVYDDIVFTNDRGGDDESNFTEVAQRLFKTGQIKLTAYTEVIKAIAKKYA